MKALLVDDEKAARERLKRLLRPFTWISLLEEAQDGMSALDRIEASKPDLVFLDIQMPVMSGFELLQKLPEETRPLIIFITGYDEYAMQAFDRHALAYLLKPVDPAKLTVALQRAEKILASESRRSTENSKTTEMLNTLAPPQLLVGKRQNRFFLLRPQKILWIAMEGGVPKAFTQSEYFWLTETLNELETRLVPFSFFRARRDLLVNLNGIQSVKLYDRSSFVLTMGDVNRADLVVSERQAKHLRSLLPGL